MKSHEAQDIFKLDIKLGISLNSWSFCFHLPNAGITGIHHQTWMAIFFVTRNWICSFLHILGNGIPRSYTPALKGNFDWHITYSTYLIWFVKALLQLVVYLQKSQFIYVEKWLEKSFILEWHSIHVWIPWWHLMETEKKSHTTK